MRKIFGVVAGLFIALMVAVLLAPFFVPVDKFKPVIARQVEAATGRAFNIEGDMHLSILPRLSLVAEDVSLSNPPGQGYKNAEMLHISSLDIDIALLPLLRGEVDIKRFVLQDPYLDLEETAQGQNNWTLTPTVPASHPAPATGPGTHPQATAVHLPAGLALAGVAIHNGTVVYSAPGTPDQTVKHLEADIRLSAFDKPLDTTVSAIIDGQPVRVAMHLATPASLLGNHAAGLDISAATPSLGSFTSRMHVAIAADTFSTNITSFDVKTPAVAATGTGNLQLHVPAGKTPSVQANLNFGKVTYTPQTAPATQAKALAKPAAKAAPGPWPTTPVDLSPLAAMNGSLALHADTIVLPQATFAPFDGTITLNNRTMDVVLKKLGAYGGAMNGNLHVSGREALPAVSASLRLQGLDTGAALAALKLPLKAHGTLSGTADFAATGKTVADMARTTDGHLDILLDKGGLENVDLPGLMKQSFGPVGAALSPKISPKANTLLAANAQSLHLVGTAQNGVLTLSHIDIAGPVMAGNGGGTISLPEQALNLKINATLNPQMVDARDVIWKDGIPLPFTVKGALSAPVYGPDASVLSTFAAKEAADRAVHYASKKLGVNLGGVLGALTGAGSNAKDPSPGKNDDAAGKLLNDLFGK